ncbi:GNAT family N-acetyltransferase [Arthrobacter sp. zg-Y1110]|uniref:GNAT family N-acetyltransferase n=1 Tax=Arthrobacter sp. zg-Y1110 TaxID=2886932 RepID=UPI001D157C9D|nr:GNAT family protein [Arthrobacter sp. zg-Y1110]MCC3289755.1 GNAT family N-acetyltransferase [Arthrobacter sp. zg-Y1110]UWX84827.1 GNAT family N-acetyltransferase [Arthrobacter sp. zg-Y1110]
METTTGIPPWPSAEPQYANVRLRAFRDTDVGMAMELAQDKYVPTVGSLPARATHGQALEWLEQQRQRHAAGTGFSFAVADAETDQCVGQIGLWGWELQHGRAQAGYGIMPTARGHRFAANALRALLEFAWTIPELHRVEAYIEPWNTASIRSAELAGFAQEGLLRSYMEISGQRRDLLIYGAVRGHEG